MCQSASGTYRHQEVPSVRDEFGVCERFMFKIGTNRKKRGEYPCPVCAFGLDYPAEDFTICPSCGVEFGYETAGRSFAELRHEWIATGAHWASPVISRPSGWNPWLQLINAGYQYEIRFPIRIAAERQNSVTGEVNAAPVALGFLRTQVA